MEITIQELTEFKPVGNNKRKKQILLTHTGRPITDYISGLQNRLNGDYKKLPHYVISREGEIIQIIPPKTYSKFLETASLNKQTIIISLENLGWLQKEPLKNYYVNWIGDIYNGKVYEKKWRDYFFSEPYTKTQIEKTVELCKNIFSEMSINPQFIGHNTKINGIEKYEGVVSRSNFDVNYTDVNPSFDFEYFLNELENEEYT